MVNLLRGCNILLFSTLIWFMAGCTETPKPAASTSHFRMLDDTVVKYNRGVVMTESQEIDDFARRHRWTMQQTPTGLRFLEYRKGTGSKPEKGDVVVIRYLLQLLNGDTVYTSVNSGPREFAIGHSEAESGLEEGVMLMRTGSRAKLIVPSHLAFGLLGDLKRIPEQAVLVYDIELVEVKEYPRKN